MKGFFLHSHCSFTSAWTNCWCYFNNNNLINNNDIFILWNSFFICFCLQILYSFDSYEALCVPSAFYKWTTCMGLKPPAKVFVWSLYPFTLNISSIFLFFFFNNHILILFWLIETKTEIELSIFLTIRLLCFHLH